MGIARPRIDASVSPYTSLDARTAGSIARGTPSRRSSSSSQSSVWMLKSSVRLALLTSVTWQRPPVSRQMRNVSTVPNRISPDSARARRPGIVSSRCLILVPEKYASTTRPVFWRINGSAPSAFRRSQMGALTRLCQTMALATGLPVCRSQRIVVSRWLVTPIAAMSVGLEARARQRLARRRDLRRPDRLRVVLDVAGRWKDLRELLLSRGHGAAIASEDDGAAGGRALVEGENVGHEAGGEARAPEP